MSAMPNVPMHRKAKRRHGEELPELLPIVDTIRVASWVHSATAEGFRRGKPGTTTYNTEVVIVTDGADINFAEKPRGLGLNVAAFLRSAF